MPQGENFWNPYRWVPVSKDKLAREAPGYRHQWQGLSGRLECMLEALTPFLIGSGTSGVNRPVRFIRSGRTNQPFIPGTSLKGLIRSLVELIGNATIPFPQGHADQMHSHSQASQGKGEEWHLDMAARMFGYLNRGQVFAGLVQFSDGELRSAAKEIGPFSVVVGQPQPVRHKPFYPDEARRKFYHHHPEATGLIQGTTQTRKVYALAKGVQFRFRVNFENLREEELALLLYCLVLEENATVTLSKEALGPDAQGAVTLAGPLRHKFGGCKPQGGGSIKISIDKMELQESIADRYRSRAAAPPLEGEELLGELRRRTQAITARTDQTMLHLRAMLLYSENDPRKPMEYPDYIWFQQDKGTGRPLKPTL